MKFLRFNLVVALFIFQMHFNQRCIYKIDELLEWQRISKYGADFLPFCKIQACAVANKAVFGIRRIAKIMIGEYRDFRSQKSWILESGIGLIFFITLCSPSSLYIHRCLYYKLDALLQWQQFSNWSVPTDFCHFVSTCAVAKIIVFGGDWSPS